MILIQEASHAVIFVLFVVMFYHEITRLWNCATSYLVVCKHAERPLKYSAKTTAKQQPEANSDANISCAAAEFR